MAGSGGGDGKGGVSDLIRAVFTDCGGVWRDVGPWD